MGAEFSSTKIYNVKTFKILSNRYAKIVKDCQFELGHGGYTGSFAESPGLTITDIEVENDKDADDYLVKYARKWENTLAVRIKGTDNWVIGGIFSS